MRMNTVVILIYAIEFHGFRNLTIAREKACMVITYNANMTPAARRRDYDSAVRVKYFWDFDNELALGIFCFPLPTKYNTRERK